MAQNSSNPDSSNDTHYIDMKVIAYRKKLEDEKIQQQEIEKQKIQIQDFKTSFYNAFKDQLKNSFINSLYFTVPLGTGLMVARKSLLIVPFTMFLGFTGQFYYDLKTKDIEEQYRYQHVLKDTNKKCYQYENNNKNQFTMQK